ncbi:precorrin-2 dehydrogenase/sirohydrochlorin ferrochelatase family protein [Geothrix fermentans]|jgi:siroheme synthase-like protein|uniref:precorrin-2 dehydrogenase/sirohydrochlorin ferrochelatase family protein n=1 Tax=Geothrix fermentans TaxID=44676 RepID=UPI00047ED582|nr:bifunctional precorrin-2 dehydrogenase/sirohydrochlorin ferrochelatase [Geothrix fermentans]
MSLLPLFLDLRGKQVLVVGGGSVAQAKLRALRPTGCRIRAVSPAFNPAFLAELAAFDTERHDRAFVPEDLDGVHLVITATNDPAANAVVAAHARSQSLWVNAVDDAASCDALFPSILRRGPFVAALSTEGAFAGLSRVVREALEGLVPDAAIPEFEALVQLRRQLRQSLPDPAERAERLRSLLRQVQQEALPAEAHR